MNGSSDHSTRSSSPEIEFVGDLPPGQPFEQAEQRVPTPFPPIGPQLNEDLPPLPLVMPLPRQLPLNQPLSDDSSSSDEFPPVPLSPIVNVIEHKPYTLSNASSTYSCQAVGHLVRRLHDDRRLSETSPSVSSGLYEFASMMIPGLPEYPEYREHSDDPVLPGVDFDAESLQQRDRSDRNGKRFVKSMYMITALISSMLVGQQVGNLWVHWNSK